MSMSSASTILLTTLNARYMHTAFGLRYLYANMGELQSQTHIIEFTIQELPINIVEQLLSHQPDVPSIADSADFYYFWSR